MGSLVAPPSEANSAQSTPERPVCGALLTQVAQRRKSGSSLSETAATTGNRGISLDARYDEIHAPGLQREDSFGKRI